jgi:hypothetical protein
MYNNKANKEDKNYDCKIIVQHPSIYSTFKLEDNNKEKGDDGEDSYGSESDPSSLDFSEDESNAYKIALVPFILGSNGYIYFVKTGDGYCYIYEINP